MDGGRSTEKPFGAPIGAPMRSKAANHQVRCTDMKKNHHDQRAQPSRSPTMMCCDDQ